MKKFALSLALLPCAVCAQVDLAKDERLRSPIEVRAKIVSLRDFVATIAAETRAPLSVGAAIADRKVTAFVKDRPASEVLEKLAATFLFEWEQEKDGRYILRCPPKIAAEERALLDKEDRAGKTRAKTRIDSWMEGAKHPMEELVRQSDDARLELKALQEDHSPAGNAKRADLDRAIWNLDDQIQHYGLGAMFLQMNDAAWSRFWQGEPAIGSSHDRGTPFRLPATVVSPALTVNGAAPIGQYCFARYRPERAGLEFQVQAIYAQVAGGKTFSVPAVGGPEDIDRELQSDPFLRRLDAWSTDLRLIPKEIAERKMSESRQLAPPKSEWFSRVMTAADQLELLADAAELPVMADAFRLPVSNLGYIQAGTVGQWLQAFQAARSGYFNCIPGRFRVVDGWIMYRHGSFWRRNLAETPERAFAPIEARFAKEKRLTLEDYAAFYAPLTPLQRDALSARFAVVARFDLGPLADLGVVLPLWHSMSMAQKQEAAGPEGIALAGLSPASAAHYWSATLESVWHGLVPDNEVRRAIFVGSDGQLEQRMRLYVQYNAELFAPPNIVPSANVGLSTERTKGIRFLLGPTPASSVEYSATLANRPIGN